MGERGKEGGKGVGRGRCLHFIIRRKRRRETAEGKLLAHLWSGYFGCNSFCVTATFSTSNGLSPSRCISLALWSSGRSRSPSSRQQNTYLLCSLFDLQHQGLLASLAVEIPLLTFFTMQAEVTNDEVCTQHSAFLCSPAPSPDSYSFRSVAVQSFDFGFSSFTEGIHSVLQNLVQHVS